MSAIQACGDIAFLGMLPLGMALFIGAVVAYAANAARIRDLLFLLSAAALGAGCLVLLAGAAADFVSNHS